MRGVVIRLRCPQHAETGGSPMKSPRIVVTLASLAVAAAMLAGCNGSPAVPGGQDSLTRLRVSGSGTCLPLLRILAAEQPDSHVRLVFLPGLHSGGGIKGATQGSLDIGAVSRNLTDSERAAGLKVTWLSKDGLVVAVNQSVGNIGIKALTTAQVKDIYAGKYKNWKELGADKDLGIVVLDRHEDESAKIIMRTYVFGSQDEFKVDPRSVNLYYESDMVDALQTTTGAIGYFSLGYALSQGVPVKLLALDGVEPTVENVQSGEYKIVRPLGVVTKTDAPKAVEDFISWATGPEARRIMTQKGYVPYTK